MQEEQDWHVSCYLNHIKSFNKPLPPWDMPKTSKWELHPPWKHLSPVVYALDSNTLLLVGELCLYVHQIRQQKWIKLSECFNGSMIFAVPPQNFFSPADGENYTQFAFIYGGDLSIYNWKTPKKILHIYRRGHTPDACSKGLLYLTKKHLISPSYYAIVLWDLEHKTSWEAATEAKYIYCAENIGNGKIAAGQSYGTISIYQAIENGTILYKFKLLHKIELPKQSMVLCISLVDPYTLAASGEENTRAWDLRTYECIMDANRVNKNNIVCILSIGHGKIATSSRDSNINIWDMSTGTVEATLQGHTTDVMCMTMLDSKTLVSASRDSVRAWIIMEDDICMFERLVRMESKPFTDVEINT
jgi:WD40 repeat protein